MRNWFFEWRSVGRFKKTIDTADVQGQKKLLLFTAGALLWVNT